jgi:hypothetical protein
MNSKFYKSKGIGLISDLTIASMIPGNPKGCRMLIFFFKTRGNG